MKKYLFTGLFIILVVMVIGGGFYFWVKLDERSIKKESGVVRNNQSTIIGIDPNYAPMEFMDTKSKMVGFDVDLIDSVFSLLGEKYELLTIQWDQKTELLNSGEIDLIWSGLSVTDKRKPIYEFSDQYIETGTVIVVPESSNITNKFQIANKVIGAEAAGVSIGVVEKFNKDNPNGKIKSIKKFQSSPESMVAILKGQVDAAAVSNLVGEYYSAKNPGKFRVITLEKTGSMAVAAKKGNKERIEKINKALSSLIKNGELSRIRKRWFGK